MYSSIMTQTMFMYTDQKLSASVYLLHVVLHAKELHMLYTIQPATGKIKNSVT